MWQPTQTQLSSFVVDETIFDEIERSCGVRVSKAQGDVLVELMAVYSYLFWYFTDFDRSKVQNCLLRFKRLSTDTVGIDLAAGADKASEMAYNWLWWVIGPPDWRPPKQLQIMNVTAEAVAGATAKFRRIYRRKGRPRKDRHRLAVLAFAELFKELGGTPTVSFDAIGWRRCGAFLRFLEIIERRLPVDVGNDFSGRAEMAKGELAPRKRTSTNKVFLPDFLPFL